jgi:hypothetical protein
MYFFSLKEKKLYVQYFIKITVTDEEDVEYRCSAFIF